MFGRHKKDDDNGLTAPPAPAPPAVAPAPAPAAAGGTTVDLSGLIATVQAAKQASGGDRQELAEMLRQQLGSSAVIVDGQNISVDGLQAAFGTAMAAGQAAPLPAPAAPAPDPLVQVERLAALHEKGMLTDAEFAAQKARVLGET